MFNIRLYCNKRKTVSTPASTSVNLLQCRKPHCCCGICKSAFDSDTEVQIHRSIAHQEILQEIFQRRHGCQICLKTFEFSKQLIVHVRRAHLFIKDPKGTKITRPIYVCDICSNIFFNKQMLAYHMQLKHKFLNHELISNCPKCEKSLRLKSVLQHMDFIHLRSVKSCPICLEYQPTMKSYYSHIDNVHAPTLKCNFCKYHTSNDTELNSHLETTHGRRATRVRGSVSTWMFFTQCRELEKMHRLKAQFVDRGVNLYDMINVCILCQETCRFDQKRMAQHLVKEHGHNMTKTARGFAGSVSRVEAVVATPIVKRCECGATFTTEVMLKHHIFREHEMGHMTVDTGAGDGCGDEGQDEQTVLWS